MLATVTLTTTTFGAPIAEQDTNILLGTVAGIVRGSRIFANREMMAVELVTGIGNYVTVRRGVDGTMNRMHNTGETVYLGRADQFYNFDPQGSPPVSIPVYPHINTVSGIVWTVQGDDIGPGQQNRSWQPIESYQVRGTLGVRVNTSGVGLDPADPSGGVI